VSGSLQSPRTPLSARIQALLEEESDRPWCVHRLYERLYAGAPESERAASLAETHRAADELYFAQLARREYVSAISIGIHCDDTLFWSVRSNAVRLADFGPEYESPTILRRIGSHFVCRGL